jgi:hypothetical protein
MAVDNGQVRAMGASLTHQINSVARRCHDVDPGLAQGMRDSSCTERVVATHDNPNRWADWLLRLRGSWVAVTESRVGVAGCFGGNGHVVIVLCKDARRRSRVA